MNDILTMVFAIAGGLVALAVAYVAPTAKAWLKEKVGEAEYARIKNHVHTFVTAAEQTLKSTDPLGVLRHEDVVKKLQEAGIAITTQVLSMIEEEVLALGHATAKKTSKKKEE